METNLTLFEIMKPILFWSSPVIFVIGVLLVTYSNYKKIENLLAKEIGGIKKRVIAALETNIYSFHDWLLKRRTLIGFICIISSLVFFWKFRK